MREVQLSKFGLWTVEEAATARGVAARTVQRWIEAGAVSVVVVGEGRNRKFLVLIEEVKKYAPAPPGAPEGNTNAVKDKTEKQRTKKKGKRAGSP